MKKYRILSFSLVLFMILNSFSIQCKADDNNLRLVTNEIAVDVFGSSLLSLTGFYQTPASSFSYFDSNAISGFNDVSLFPFNPFSSTSVYMIGSVSNGNLQIVAFDLSGLDNYVSSVVTNQGLAIKCSDNESHTLNSINGFKCSFFKDNKTWSSVTLSNITVSFNRQKQYNITDTYETDYPVSNNKSPIYFYIPENDDYAFYTDSIVFNGSGFSLAYTNADHVYSIDDLWNYFYAPVATQGSSISNYFANICLNSLYTGVANTVTDFIMDGYVPYFNGTEVIVPDIPTEDTDESNLNHLYLTNFDAGFCKPYHNEDLWRSGGGYMYLKYNFDSWINSHISDYNLQIITQLDVDGTTTTYPTVRNLDAQGVSVFSFKEMASSFAWNDQNMLFLEYPDSLFGNYNIGYVYSLSSSQFIQTGFGPRAMGSGGRNRLFYSRSGSTRQLSGNETNEQIEEIFTGSSHSQFKISVIVRLVDVSTLEVSGSYVETFDLISGVSTVSNDQIRDNSNPYVPSDSVYLPVDNSEGGYLVSGSGDVVNVYNMTPSEIKLTIDNGLEKFINWYNTSSEVGTTVNSFWASFGIFKNNPATELYTEYFGFLPSGFKTILLGAATIGIVGGVFSMLRRKLT